jgi:hypothetical protein
MRKRVLLSFSFSISVFANSTHDASKNTAGVVGSAKTLQVELCMKNYKEIAGKICRDFRKLDLSKNQIKKVKDKIAEISKSDNMWWTEDRISDAHKFLENYQDTSGAFRVGQELWCTLGLEKGDEYEKSLAWAEERCRGDLMIAVRKDSEGFEQMSYMFKNLSGQGLKDEARIADGIDEKLVQLRKRTGAFGASEIDTFIKDLAAAKDRARGGSVSDKLKFRSMLKDCYEMEKLNPKVFSLRRKNAPSGYDCASFDSRENP